MKLLYDVLIGFFSSVFTIFIFHFISRYRIRRIYKNIVGYYIEVDKKLIPNFPGESYEIVFSMNYFKDNPELKISFISGKNEKADWSSTFSITPPNFYHLVAIFKYVKNKDIPDFDFNDVGLHNIYIIPDEKFIQIEVIGIKYPYPKHSYTLKKV